MSPKTEGIGWIVNSLSFCRSKKNLGWSKFFVSDQKLMYILWQSQKSFPFSKFGFCASTNVFEEALNAIKFLDWLKKFGPAKNILGPVEARRTRHKCNLIFGLAPKIWTDTKHFGTCRRTRYWSGKKKLDQPKRGIRFSCFIFTDLTLLIREAKSLWWLKGKCQLKKKFQMASMIMSEQEHICHGKIPGFGRNWDMPYLTREQLKPGVSRAFLDTVAPIDIRTNFTCFNLEGPVKLWVLWLWTLVHHHQMEV